MHFPPFGFVLKAVWSIHMSFNIVMATDLRADSISGTTTKISPSPEDGSSATPPQTTTDQHRSVSQINKGQADISPSQSQGGWVEAESTLADLRSPMSLKDVLLVDYGLFTDCISANII